MRSWRYSNMTTSPVDMRATQMQMQDQLVQGQSRDIGNLVASGKGHKTDAQKDAKLRESCEGFESIFIQKMWQQMRATLPKTNMLQGKDEQYWQSMYDQELAKNMASAGGIGLAKMMYEQLSRDLVSASRTTASATQQRNGGGFAATAAPLLQPSAQQVQDQQQAASALSADKGTAGTTGTGGKGLGQDMYSGAAPQPEGTGAENAANPNQTIAQNGAQNGAAAPAAQAVGQAADDGETSPVVQQFLAELRQRQAQQGTTAEQTAPGSASPMSAAPQGATVAQHSVQQGPGGVSRSQRAQLDAANKPAGGGVMPAMQGQQAPQRSARLTPPAASTAMQPQQAQQAMTMPAGAQAAFVPPNTQNAAQGQNVTPQQNATHMQAVAVPQGTVTQAQAAMQSSGPVAAQAQALMAQANAPVTTPQAAEQQPQVINTTFTTNIPKNRRSQRQRGQRLPSGQPSIRTLPTPAPATPIATTSTPGAAAGVQGAQPAVNGVAPVAAPAAAQPAVAPTSPQALAPQAATQGMPQNMYQPVSTGTLREG